MGASEDHHDQDIEPVGNDGGKEATDGVGQDGTRGELTVVHRVKHGSVGAQEAAPAHADGGEHCDSITIDPTLLDEPGHQTECGTDGAEGRDGEADEVRIVEPNEPLEDETDFLAEPRQNSDTFVGYTGVSAVSAGREGENHHERGDDDDTGNDSQTHIDTGAATIEQGVENAQKERLVLLVFDLKVGLGEFTCRFFGILGMGLLDEVLHEARGDHTPEDGSDESDEGLLEEAVTHHEDDDDQAHTEGRAEVGQRDELVFLEMGSDAFILRKCDDSGVVAQEGEHGTERSHTGQIEQRLHQGPQRLLQQVNDTELNEQTSNSTSDDADGHEEKTGVEQEVMGGVHDGIEHVGCTHLDGQAGEQGDDD